MSDETMLMEFEVKKDILLDALVCASNIAKEIAVGILEDTKGNNDGIIFNRGVDTPNIVGSKYRTMHYVNYPIFDDQMRHFKVHVKEWPFVFFSCTDQLIRALKILPPKTASDEDGGDYLRVTIYQIEIDSDNVESHVIIHGLHGANVGSRIWHPISPKSNEAESVDMFCQYG